MSYLINSIIYILLGVVGVACAVKAKEVNLDERQNINSSRFVDELELLSRIYSIGAKERPPTNDVYKAEGIIVNVLRGRAQVEGSDRNVYVLVKRSDWSWSNEAYFWVKLKETTFLKSGLQIEGPISVSQSANLSPKVDHRDYDLYYQPKLAIAPYVLSQDK